VLDGNLPREIVKTLIEKLKKSMNDLTPEGVFVPEISLGKVGPDARAIGGAILPFYVNFSPDKAVMITGD
jgi:hypothetical protein